MNGVLSRVLLALLAALAVTAICTGQTAPVATAPAESAPPLAQPSVPPDFSLGFYLGYRHLDIGDHRISFPLDSGVPGSVKTAHVGRNLDLAALGFREEIDFNHHWVFNLDLGGLVGSHHFDNNNTDDDDSSDDLIPAFLSSANWGGFTSLGASYYFSPQFYLGGEAQVSAPYVFRADRYGINDNRTDQYYIAASAGPKVGWRINDQLSAEGTVQFGKHISYGVNLVFLFR
jgi:hypothetical protein